jgi:hypothetical protein
VYWVENGAFDYTSELRRMPRAGGAIETLYSTNAAAHGLALGDDAAFLVTTLGGSGNYSGTVVRVPKDGTAPTTLTTAFNPTSIAVDGDWVYYNEAASPEGAIRRVATTGGDPELVVDVADNPYDLAAQAGVLYYSEMNVGRMMRVVPGEQPTELAAGWIGTVWMAVDATHVYFCGCETGECAEPRLYRVPLDGGETELLATGTRNEGKIAVTDGAVLWGEWFVPLDGTEPTKLLHSGTDGMLVIGVAAAGDDLYAADYYSGAIYRF